MHTYERSSIINLLIIAKILIFGVIVVNIRRAEEKDIPQIEELLYQVHKVHSDKRPDLFIPGSKKYTTNELKEILADDEKPVYVADNDGVILGYAFCVYQRHCTKSSNYTSLYIDDLCVSENSRGLKSVHGFMSMYLMLPRKTAVIILPLMYGNVTNPPRSFTINAD